MQTFTPLLAAFPLDKKTLEIFIINLSFKVMWQTIKKELNLEHIPMVLELLVYPGTRHFGPKSSVCKHSIQRISLC